MERGSATITVEMIELIEDWVVSRIDSELFGPSMSALAPSERQLLHAISSCDYPPLRNDDIVRRSGRTHGYVNVALIRLVEKGVIYRRAHGQYEYTLPRFHEYLRRQDPT